MIISKEKVKALIDEAETAIDELIEILDILDEQEEDSQELSESEDMQEELLAYQQAMVALTKENYELKEKLSRSDDIRAKQIDALMVAREQRDKYHKEIQDLNHGINLVSSSNQQLKSNVRTTEEKCIELANTIEKLKQDKQVAQTKLGNIWKILGQ